MSGHVAAQRAVVRMLFDPAFAEAVRADPDGALAAVPPALRRQLAAVDPRALGLDALRRRRTLRILAEEWKGTTTLVLAETRSLAALERFFSSSAFHASVEERGSMPLAFAAWVAEEIAERRLETPALAGVLAIETALAQSRRAVAVAIDVGAHVAPGVFLVDTTQGAMAALNQAEKYLFEVNLMPAVALCEDAPRLALDARASDATPLHLVTVPHAGQVTLVTIEADLALVLRAAQSARTVERVIAEAVARGVPHDRARALLDELIDGELVIRR